MRNEKKQKVLKEPKVHNSTEHVFSLKNTEKHLKGIFVQRLFHCCLTDRVADSNSVLREVSHTAGINASIQMGVAGRETGWSSHGMPVHHEHTLQPIRIAFSLELFN